MSRATTGQLWPRAGGGAASGSSENLPDTLALRDDDGDFAAGEITAETGFVGNLTGLASRATQLNTARNINGVAFDGTAPITVTAAAGTLSGTALAANVVTSSLTVVGTLVNLTVTNPITGSVTGSAATLTTARNINGVSFNGSADITVTAAAGTLTGGTLASGVTASSLISVGASLAIGTTPAATGEVRLPSAGVISFRNNANTGNVQFVTKTTGDNFLIGTSSVTTIELTTAAGSIDYHGDYLRATVDNVADLGATGQYFKNGFLYTLSLKASTTGREPLIIPHGAAPTAPTDGSFWSTSTGFFGRVNGSTVGPFNTGAPLSGLTTGTLPKAASASTLTNSVLTESSGLITIDSSTGALAVGQTTASAGRVRVPNNGTTQARNNANSANIIMFKVGTDDILYCGTDSTGSSNTGVTMNGNLLVFSDNSFNIGASGATRFGTIYAATAFTVGTNPATAGGVRIPNNTNISFRNNANNANIGGMLLTTGDNFQVGATAAGSVQIANASGVIQLNSTNWVYAGDDTCGLGTQANRFKSLYLSGGITRGIVSKAANYTATANDHTILGDTTSGGFTITLPAAASHTGRQYVIKKISADANTLTVDPNGTETIDGSSTSVAIIVQWASIRIQSNGTSWFNV